MPTQPLRQSSLEVVRTVGSIVEAASSRRAAARSVAARDKQSNSTNTVVIYFVGRASQPALAGPARLHRAPSPPDGRGRALTRTGTIMHRPRYSTDSHLNYTLVLERNSLTDTQKPLVQTCSKADFSRIRRIPVEYSMLYVQFCTVSCFNHTHIVAELVSRDQAR